MIRSAEISLKQLAFSRENWGLAEISGVTAAGVLLATVLVSGKSSLILLVLIVIASPLVLYRWPFGALLLLVISSAMPRYTAKLFSLTVKPEHLVTALTMAALIIIYRQRKAEVLNADLLLAAFVGLNFISSAFTSPDVKATLTHSVLFVLVALPYWIVPRLVNSRERLQLAFRIVLGIGIAEASFGILCWAANYLAGTQLGITRYTYLGNLPGLHGSQWEPNIFGSYVASVAAMFLFCQLKKTSVANWCWPGLLITIIATLLSMARAAWLGLLVAALFAFLSSRGAKEQQQRVWKILLLASCVAAGVTTLVLSVAPLRERVISLAPADVIEDTTLVHRLVYTGRALQDIQQQPWFGHGAESFELLWTWDTDKGEVGAWVGNIFIRVLHDTGVVGLTTFCGFLYLLFARAYRVWKADPNTVVGQVAGGLISANIVLAVAYQFTEASLLSFTWLNFGLVSAASRLGTRHRAGLPNARALFDERRQAKILNSSAGEQLP